MHIDMTKAHGAGRETAMTLTLLRQRSRGALVFLLCAITVLIAGCKSNDDDDDRPVNDPETITLMLVAPEEGDRLDNALTPLRYSYTGNNGEISVASATANNADITPIVQISDAELVVIPTTDRPWEPGPLIIEMRVSDTAGGGGSITSNFDVARTTQTLPRANPVSGFAPLTVSLLPDAVTDSIIELYEWDIDGNGVFDESVDTIGRTIQWTFDAPGTYPVALRVTDTQGQQSVEEIVITAENRPPMVVAEAVPSNGAIPLESFFTVAASDNEGIALYEIDFDGDGAYDESSQVQGQFSFNYTEPGNFQPSIRVTDALGIATEVATPDIRVFSLSPGSPTINASASFGRDLRVPLTVSFRARVSDPDREPVASWSWDFDGDGVSDSTESDGATHIYERPGIYYATVSVVSSDGDTSQDVVRIEALPSFELSYSTTTIVPDDGETIDVGVIVGGVTPTGLDVEDRGGNVVRTLYAFSDLAAGDYTFTWDGTDDQGERVPHGPYSIILSYEYRGPVERIESSAQSTGVAFRPILVSATAGRFQPFANNPVRLEVELAQAGEFTLFMGNADTDQRTKTFFERTPFGAGIYNFEWHGVNTAGRLVPNDGTRYTVGMFGFSLGDNVVFVRDPPELDVLDVSPKIYTPDSLRPATFSMMLSEPARVELQIRSLNTGGAIRTLRSDANASGIITIDWDGTTQQDGLPAPGRYSATAVAVDSSGSRSYERTNLFHIAY